MGAFVYEMHDRPCKCDSNIGMNSRCMRACRLLSIRLLMFEYADEAMRCYASAALKYGIVRSRFFYHFVRGTQNRYYTYDMLTMCRCNHASLPKQNRAYRKAVPKRRKALQRWSEKIYDYMKNWVAVVKWDPETDAQHPRSRYHHQHHREIVIEPSHASCVWNS